MKTNDKKATESSKKTTSKAIDDKTNKAKPSKVDLKDKDDPTTSKEADPNKTSPSIKAVKITSSDLKPIKFDAKTEDVIVCVN